MRSLPGSSGSAGPTPNLSLSLSQISLSCARCLVLPGVRSLPGSSKTARAGPVRTQRTLRNPNFPYTKNLTQSNSLFTRLFTIPLSPWSLDSSSPIPHPISLSLFLSLKVKSLSRALAAWFFRDLSCARCLDGLFGNLPIYLLGFFSKYECWWVTNLIMLLYHFIFFGLSLAFLYKEVSYHYEM